MSDDNAPDPAHLLKLARQALTSSEYRKKFHYSDFWSETEFYAPQLKFFAEGANHGQRLIRGGNQTGKTMAAAFEASLHMTGQYPRWWRGATLQETNPRLGHWSDRAASPRRSPTAAHGKAGRIRHWHGPALCICR